ncbi:MAG: TdeIII family type II restriction endonuclease [Ignavibacteria bacterium]|nr:TdeIII family type II restriction endonuclease [Ignavibacteria bacterium]
MLIQNQINTIERVIEDSLRKKLQNYHPETNNMPFHYRLLGKDRMALYSFIQSLNTTFGTSIFEPVAVALAKNNFKKVERQFFIGDTIKEEAQQVIQEIINNLTIGSNPDKQKEIDLIRRKIKSGRDNKMKTIKVDIYLENFNGEQYFIDLKTVKPNISNFKDFKRTLLEWIGIALTRNPQAKVNSLIAIPYNPYEPEPYQRWTIKGMLDDKYELLVGKEFWDFLGGDGAYESLLECFEKAGLELRSEIDEYFAKYRSN